MYLCRCQYQQPDSLPAFDPDRPQFPDCRNQKSYRMRNPMRMIPPRSHQRQSRFLQKPHFCSHPLYSRNSPLYLQNSLLYLKNFPLYFQNQPLRTSPFRIFLLRFYQILFSFLLSLLPFQSSFCFPPQQVFRIPSLCRKSRNPLQMLLRPLLTPAACCRRRKSQMRLQSLSFPRSSWKPPACRRESVLHVSLFCTFL